jgi:DNA sulfur modification protein DndB
MKRFPSFADLNIHAVRPTRSIKLLYDHRDALAGLSRDVVAAVPLFREFACFDSSSISHRSIKLFTLSSIHQATAELIGKTKSGVIGLEDKEAAVEFWKAVIASMPDWQRVGTRLVSAYELRRDYIHAHGLAVQAIAAAGAQLLKSHPKDWRKRLSKLQTIDWSRSNRTLWDNRALVAGKVSKSRNNVVLVTNVIVKALGMPLSQEGQRIEDLYAPQPVTTLRVAS